MLVRFQNQEQIQLAVEVLRNGGIVAFPTDTLYGLGADASNETAVRRIFRVKERPLTMPLPVLVADMSQIAQVASFVPELAWRLARRFLPGGLTLVLSKAGTISPTITAGSLTVAVRIPAHPVPLALIRSLGSPLTGTSANLSGRPAPVTAVEVYQQLGEKVDLILDGGKCPGGIESTIVDVSGKTPLILRQGAISREEIEAEIAQLRSP